MTLFSRLLARTRHRTIVAAVYGAIVAAARHPRLYDPWGVPDTVDGRFDMVALRAAERSFFQLLDALHHLRQWLLEHFGESHDEVRRWPGCLRRRRR